MEFREVVRRRRMVRRYSPEPVDPSVVDRMLEHAQRAPNAGFTQGWAFLVLDTPDDVALFWEATGADPDTHNAWLDGMRTAPVVIVPLASKEAYLERYPVMAELYNWKERLHGFYRIRGYERAKTALTHILDAMARSELKEIKTLRRTLLKWRNEILNYFRTRLTNAMVEGFNNKAKLVKRRAYGYRSFSNYRLRLLDACS